MKGCLLLGRKGMTNLDSILKSRDITLPTKVHLVKAMVFPVVMYGCESWTIKKAEHWRFDAFNLWCWRRLLRVPWTARRSNQSILNEISPEYSLEGLMLKLKLQYLGHLMWRTDSLEKTLMLGKIKGGRKGGDRGWDSRMASHTRWTWVWISSGSWWWTEKPGVLQSMGLQRCWLSKTWLSNWTELTEVLQDKNSINMKPGLQSAHRLMITSVYIHPGVISRNPEQQFLKCRPRSGRAAWDLFPIGTPDVLWRRTPQHWLSLVVVIGLVTKLCLTLATPWTVSRQASLTMGFPRQEYWSQLLFPSPGDLPNRGIKPGSPAL